MDIKALQEQRNKLLKDFNNNIVPERMPVRLSFGFSLLAAKAGLDPVEAQFDYGKMAEAAKTVSSLVYSDSCPVAPASIASRIPGAYQLMESQSFRMAANGQMQHPEVVGMLDTEYDQLIADPYACIMETVIPRQQKAFGLEDPITRAIRIDMVKAENQRQLSISGKIVRELIEENGYYSGAPAGSGGFTAAPFDFLGDQLRSFSGICKDVRRRREQVAEACQRLLPLMFRLGMPSNPDPEGAVGMPLHMPTYLRQKDFEELWLPTYLELVRQYAARGVRTRPFLEENWMKYIDIIQDFPAGTIMAFEQGDPVLVKEKLGKKFFTTGMFPIMLMKTGTKEEILDKAKEMLDIMLPGCGYFFGFDKGALQLSDINPDNYLALSEYLRDNAKYDNVGGSFGMKINAEGYTVNESIGDFDSKYKFNWDEYLAKNPLTPASIKEQIEQYDNNELRFYLNLLV